MRLFVLLSIIALNTASCSDAKKSNEVVPYIVPEGFYNGYSCNDLMRSTSELMVSVPELETLVDKKHEEQAVISAAAILIWWPFGFALDRKHIQEQRLAAAVGRITTMSSIYKRKGC